MTRKDYVRVSTVINTERIGATSPDVLESLERVAGDLAAWFAGDNPRFDKGRFLAACGFGN